MDRDAREVTVSCDNRKALDLYETALLQYHSYVGDPIATIDNTIPMSAIPSPPLTRRWPKRRILCWAMPSAPVS